MHYSVLKTGEFNEDQDRNKNPAEAHVREGMEKKHCGRGDWSPVVPGFYIAHTIL